jgi:hypothetical protein
VYAQIVDDSQCDGQKSATVAAKNGKKNVKAHELLLTNKTVAPLFLSETVTQSRGATPDSALAVSLVSTLGGGAGSVREMIKIYQS